MTIDTIFHFFLVFARLSAAITIIPPFSDGRIGKQTKLLLILAISFIVFPFIESQLPDCSESTTMVTYHLVAEILVGMLLGLSVQIYYTSLHILGSIIAMQSSLSMATVIDPSQREHVALFTNLLTTMAAASIIATDSHHHFIMGVIESYAYFEPGQILNISDCATQLGLILSESFLIAFKTSAPFVIVGLVIVTGSSILSKLMPTLQILFVITPAQIVIMFIILHIVINQVLEMVIDNMLKVFH